MKPELLLSVDSKQSFWIDPRTKLYMLVIFSIVMIDGKTDGISFWLKPILALIPFFLLLSGRRKKIAIIYLIVFIVSWTVNVFLVPYMGLIGTIIISLLAQFGTRWFPSAMMGYYLLSTTKVSEFVLAMQRMHIPEAFIIPFSVMFRFFPTISEEAGSIGKRYAYERNHGEKFFKNPQAVLEYRIVPLMMSVVTIGNDLSAAALTRGLGNGKKRTSICKIGFHWKDFALMIIVTAALLVFLLFRRAEMIEFKDVAFQYEQGSSKGKIENINLTIHDGEVVLICGESGCGKTTLTRLINGLIPHYYEGTLTGQTIVEGIDVKNVSLYALSGVVGSVFQNPRTQFFTVDTTSEIAFGCENLAIDADEINLRIEKTVGALKIEDLLNRSLFALSGGEKQKIACASVSAMEPDIFVLDEPSSNLDIKSIRELKDVLRKWKAQGKTIVIAEHRLYYLMDIADRVLYMQGGQIKENLSISDFKKKSTGELHALGLRTLQSEDFSKMQSTVCATKQLYIRDFEVSYKNASGGKTKKRKVLDISDLMIPQGSVVGVVGNNGAGKTTFANNLCGLLKTAKGCMSMNGKTYMANQRIKTCYMVMQDVNHQLFTESVMDEILLSLDNSDEEKAVHEAESIMESLHISEFRDAHPMSLSGGQKQRVAIASAIASDKQVIVFDEPTSGLDYRHMKKVAENLRELSSLGKTLFIVTHDPELIAECCNYFVFIENGKVLWSDGWNRISRERLQKFFAFEDD